MAKRRALIGLLCCLLFLILGSVPAYAEPIVGEPHAWILPESVPAAMLEGKNPKGRNLSLEANELVARAIGRSYRQIIYTNQIPLYFRDPDGTYGFVATVRCGVVLEGTDQEVRQKTARGQYDQIYYVRIEGRYKDGAWAPVSSQIREHAAWTIPELPAGGPAIPAETVRGWTIAFSGDQPVPPIGSGLNLSDANTLRPLLEQLAEYPAEVIIGADVAEKTLLVSTQMQVQAVVVAGLDTEAILMLRTVNAYKRAPWMDQYFQSVVTLLTDRLDAAAQSAGVVPDRVATQRMLFKRGPDGWRVAEVRNYPSEYSLTVTSPTATDRFIGGLETVGIYLSPEMRAPQPVDQVTDVAATAGSTALLALWAGLHSAAMYGRAVQILRQAMGDSTGSRLVKMLSDAFDWILGLLEKPLARLSRAIGLSRYLSAEGPAEVPEAVRAPAPGGARYACSVCGTPVRDAWQHCTGCGAHLTAGPAAEAAPAMQGPVMGGDR